MQEKILKAVQIALIVVLVCFLVYYHSNFPYDLTGLLFYTLGGIIVIGMLYVLVQKLLNRWNCRELVQFEIEAHAQYAKERKLSQEEYKEERARLKSMQDGRNDPNNPFDVNRMILEICGFNPEYITNEKEREYDELKKKAKLV